MILVENSLAAPRLMKPSKQEKFATRKTQILNHAVELLIREGSRPFSMRALASECQMTLGNLQYYFPNLDALLEAIFALILEQATDKFAQLSQESGQIEALVEVVLLNLQDLSLCTLSMETWLAAKHSATLHLALSHFYQNYLNEVARLIQQQAQSIDDQSAHEQALMLMALFEGLAIVYSHRNDTMFNFDLHDRLQRSVRAIMSV